MGKTIIGVFSVIFLMGSLSINSVAIGADKTADVNVFLKLEGKMLPTPSEVTVSLSNKAFFSIYNKTIKAKNVSTVAFKDVPYGKYVLSAKDGKAGSQGLGDGSYDVEISNPYVSTTLNWQSVCSAILEVSQSSTSIEAKEPSIIKKHRPLAKEAKPASQQ